MADPNGYDDGPRCGAEGSPVSFPSTGLLHPRCGLKAGHPYENSHMAWGEVNGTRWQQEWSSEARG